MMGLCLSIGVVSLGLAQGVDGEPNNSCVQAQTVAPGPVALPFSITGSLDTPPAVADVDFFKISAPPGSVVKVHHEGAPTNKGTLQDPYLGLFDGACNLLQVNDDAGTTANASLQFAVPASGLFVIAATSWDDANFTGQGEGGGTYQITVSPPPPPIGSINGRALDAVTGMPLSGVNAPTAAADLFKCSAEDCSENVASQSLTEQGQFMFNEDFEGFPLEVGRYRVEILADQYEQVSIGPFAVAQGQNLSLGDKPVPPWSVQVSNIIPCNLLPEGGVCAYSLTLTNTRSTPFVGVAWSIVEGVDIGSVAGATQFMARQYALNMQPATPVNVAFQFNLPNTVQNGAVVCAELMVGQNPEPRFNTTVDMELFCVEKGVQTMNTTLAPKKLRKKRQLLLKRR